MLPGMDLILDMIQSGEADNVEDISAFELAFKTDIERLEKDSMLALQKFKTAITILFKSSFLAINKFEFVSIIIKQIH